MEGLVRVQKEINRARHTHVLETAERGTYQDTKKKRPSEVHSQTRDVRGRDLSGHEKKQTEQGALTFCGGGRGRDLSEDRKKPTERGTLTN